MNQLLRKMVLILLLAAGIIASGFMNIRSISVQENHVSSSKFSQDSLMITWELNVADEKKEKLVNSLSDISLVSYKDDDFWICSVKDDSDISGICSMLNRSEYVTTAEPDSSISCLSISDDFYSPSQWSLNNEGSYHHIEGTSDGIIFTTPDIDIDAAEAWSQYKTDSIEKSPVIVAVIDTGIDYEHPDLADNMWVNSGEIPDNDIDDDKNGYVDDYYGWDFFNNDNTVCHYEYSDRLKTHLSLSTDCDDHGTHCAGIIAAIANNKIGIAGIASCADVKLMSLKIHGGPDRKGGITDAIKAIKYAEQMGAKVCNISWGAYNNSGSLFSAIERSNMLFVIAAGNDGSDNDVKPLYPASFDLDNILSVAFVDANGNLAYESNYGVNSVDFAVPSTDIFSTFVGTYSSLSGSSMAAPHVTAIAALLYTYGNGLYASNVKQLILDTIKPLNTLKGFVKYPGIPSAYKALSSASLLIHDTEAPTMAISRTFDKDELVLSFNYDDIGGSGSHMLRYFFKNKTLDAFNNGTSGTIIDNKLLRLAKSGLYTFYLNDYAGNELIRTYMVIDDMVAPTITHTGYRVSNSYKKISLSANIHDSQSGIKTVKYQYGNKNASDFTSGNGTAVTPDNNGYIKFDVKKEGIYTIYTSDYRGNKSISRVYAYIRQATDISLSRSKKTLTVGEAYTLKAVLVPSNSTDVVTFKSTNKQVASVTSKGKIKAISPGTAKITAVSSSGQTSVCQITVK